MRDPHSLWTIETATRGIEERAKTKKAEDEVKATLDVQVDRHNREREHSRAEEISIGQKLIDYDLEMTAKEAQLAAYKRHEMTKTLRDAWTQ